MSEERARAEGWTLGAEPVRPRELQKRALDLVRRALELEPEPRRRYLERACGEDPALYREVNALLAEESALESGFLELSAPEDMGLAVERTLAREAPELPGPSGAGDLPERIGPYRILRLLGAGGMGKVVLAEQAEPYHRILALKLLHGLAGDARGERFLAECQALARLSHPNIATLYEAGTLEEPGIGSVPFVAMERVDGEPITDWCDRRRLTVRERLELFLGVTAGIQHAHEKSILHRDLKPGNVLVTEVDGRPQAKVIDFGIARSLDRPEEDGPAGISGSPAYMSPESASLEGAELADTRSDVHALGLLLHELVAGVLPFETGELSLLAALRRLREEDPPPASERWAALSPERTEPIARARRSSVAKLGRRLRGDLEAILSKATARERSERYSSAAELAAEIRRHLERRPVEARLPAPAYVAGRFLRRQWRVTLTLALLLVTLTAGLVARTLEARRANEEARRAQRETERAREALAESQALAAFLTDLFRVADPERRETAAATVPELLDQGVEKLRTELPDQPLTRARLLYEISLIYLNLGQREEARQTAEDSLLLRRELLDPRDPEIARSMGQLGVALRQLGRGEEALPLHLEEIEILETRPEPDPGQLALAYNSLGNLYWTMDRLDEAEAAHLRALALRRRLPEGASNLAETLNNLGVVLRQKEDWAGAKTYLLQAAAAFEETLGREHPRTSAARFNLAYVEQNLGHWQRATELFQTSLELWERIYGPEHPRTQQAYSNTARHLAARYRWREAAELYARQLAILEGAEAPFGKVRRAMRGRGLALARAGDPAAAAPILERLHELDLEHLGPEHSNTIVEAANLAWLEGLRGRLAAAETGLRQALARRLELSGPEHFHAGRILHHLAQVVARRGRPGEAEALIRRAIAVRGWSPESRSIEANQVLLDLGRILVDLGRHPEADETLQRVLQNLEDLPADHALLAETRRAAETLHRD